MAPEIQLSLAVIVKNEAESLAALLDNHRTLYDEAVVVDTGSTDGSADCARALGARVFSHPWTDDFSAARNAALGRCRGRWVLVLDCDEWIEPSDFSAMKRLVRIAGPQAFVLPQWNYTDQSGAPDFLPLDPQSGPRPKGAAGYIPALSIRLFPNLRRLRYQGRIHETLEPVVERWGIPLSLTGIPVHHLGHLQGESGHLRRRELYGRLLRAAIREKPLDPKIRGELAIQLIAEGQPDLAEKLLERTVADAPGGPESHKARLNLGRLLLARGESSAALMQFETAVRERPDWGGCWVDAARVNAQLGNRTRAAEFICEGRRLFPKNMALLALEAQVLAPSGR